MNIVYDYFVRIKYKDMFGASHTQTVRIRSVKKYEKEDMGGVIEMQFPNVQELKILKVERTYAVFGDGKKKEGAKA